MISLTAQGLAKHWSSHLLIYVCAHVRAMWKSGDSLWQRAREPFPPLGDVASRVQGSSNMHQGPGSAGCQPPSHVFSYYFLFGNIPIFTLNSTCKVLLLFLKEKPSSFLRNKSHQTTIVSLSSMLTMNWFYSFIYFVHGSVACEPPRVCGSWRATCRGLPISGIENKSSGLAASPFTH